MYKFFYILYLLKFLRGIKYILLFLFLQVWGVYKLRSYRLILDKSIKQMVDLVNKGDFKVIVVFLGFLDIKGDIFIFDLDIKYVRVK